uniref:Uncharacterized protein n=1 Tax=Myotis myotis TaxID=51298 RepID=A0A7J7UCU7_MYOMY|nr:hypothetical protein mMyoMyo1_008728 [Myotis myotis]
MEALMVGRDGRPRKPCLQLRNLGKGSQAEKPLWFKKWGLRPSPSPSCRESSSLCCDSVMENRRWAVARDHQGIRAQSVCVGGRGVSTFSVFPLFLPNSVSVGLLTIASLEAMSTLLWQPKGTLTPTLRVTQDGLCSAAGKEPPSPLASGHNRKCTLGTTSENK